MTSSRCVVVVVVVVVVALFVSLRVSLLTQGRKGEGRSFCCFCEVLCHKCFAKKSEEGQDKRSRPASLSLEEEKPKKKKREEHRRLRKSSE